MEADDHWTMSSEVRSNICINIFFCSILKLKPQGHNNVQSSKTNFDIFYAQNDSQNDFLTLTFCSMADFEMCFLLIGLSTNQQTDFEMHFLLIGSLTNQ